MNAQAFNASRAPIGLTAIPQWEPERIRRRVANVAVQNGWTLTTSLALVEAICAGPGGLDRAARATGRSEAECSAQWELLMPVTYRGGIDNQAGLLAALREAVASWADMPTPKGDAA
ncbi:hypothetical protein JI664_12790 [Rhodobacter sp. NTK016B]|uniref:hypothetical protein n=1 Tax=Rhodobacter sp. NTK016B TaxID=2759676 RepID=UPI001A8F654E|nr:hypothetical protein [Rhodobacter sp. NTK016B]MBN8292844.1 hypothetical protein [Rhodobacter sp. NTK016B]